MVLCVLGSCTSDRLWQVSAFCILICKMLAARRQLVSSKLLVCAAAITEEPWKSSCDARQLHTYARIQQLI